MAVTRPLKEGSVTTYQAKVAAGFPDILASEMDADLDTIYAAWNGGVTTANLVDGSVTTAKLAAGATVPVSNESSWGADVGIATTTPAYAGNVTATVLANRPCILTGAVPVFIQRSTASGTPVVQVICEFWFGGTATGRDGTNVRAAQLVHILPSSGESVTGWVTCYAVKVPTAAGSTTLKVFVNINSTADYTAKIIGAAGGSIAIWQLG